MWQGSLEKLSKSGIESLQWTSAKVGTWLKATNTGISPRARNFNSRDTLAMHRMIAQRNSSTRLSTIADLPISRPFVTEEGQRPETHLTKPVLCGTVLSAERALSQVVNCSFLNYNESPNGSVYSFQTIIRIIIERVGRLINWKEEREASTCEAKNASPHRESNPFFF